MAHLMTRLQRRLTSPMGLRVGLHALFLVPLVVILLMANWANLNLISGLILLIMVASLLVGLHKLANQIASVIEKGADNHFS